MTTKTQPQEDGEIATPTEGEAAVVTGGSSLAALASEEEDEPEGEEG